MSWIDRILNSPTRQALEWSARFAEERHQVLAENVANIDTPDYQSKRLDPAAFHKALAGALESEGRGGHKEPALKLRGTRQISTDAAGTLVATPVHEPPENVLFHDGTNARLEGLMTDVQENAMSYELSLNMLKSKFESLLSAIRGRVA